MDNQKLLPREVRSPWLFMTVHVLPQALLALILWRAWDLVSGEVDASGRGAYLTMIGMQIGIVTAAVAAGTGLLRRKTMVRWPLGLMFTVLNIAFLWAGLALCDNLVPQSVANWMLSPTHLIFAFLCLTGPALFYNALCVAGLSLSIPRAADIGASLVALVLIPAGWYIVIVMGMRFASFVHIPFAIGMTIFIICTAMVTFVFLRLLMWLYRVARGNVFPALLGALILPFGGLALNTAIPFPVNLQYWPVYVLTAINGIVMLLPFKTDHPSRQWVWFARIVMYPFSLYFFVLFLPFLPLSIIAMIAAGAGFLILAPTFLFVIHSRILFDETRILWRSISRAKLAVLFIVAMTLLPTGYVVRALLHRTALMNAVEAVYAPDLAVEKPKISPGITRIALKRLQSMKDGLYLPFLSEIYNHIVFNGMVLPDYKVKRISENICGEDLSERADLSGRLGGSDFSEIFFNTRGRLQSWANTRPPPRNVVLTEFRVTSLTTNGPLIEARIEVDLQNDYQSMAEYVGTFDVPPTVFVTGFELDVKGKWVAGRIFDRKSALWVYHMIRDTTRLDPGVLVYTDPRHLKLSVFPFASSEQRRCAIRMTFLAGDAPVISMDNHRVELEIQGITSVPVIQVPLKDGTSAFYVPRDKVALLPVIQRPVCVHFLLDASTRAVETLPMYSERIATFLERHPWVINTAATAVNFGSESICSIGTTPEQLLREVSRLAPRIKVRGGYCPDAAIRRLLYKELTRETPSQHATLFVIVASSKEVVVGDLDGLLDMLPDARITNESETMTPTASPVVQCMVGGSWTLLSPESGGWVFSGTNVGDAPFTVKTGTEEIIVTPDILVSADSQFVAVASLRKLSNTQMLYPARADKLREKRLSTAKQSGILAPETAYMVVENSAQWKALERAEIASLGASGALEFDEFKTPEPQVWIILIGFASWLAARHLFAGGKQKKHWPLFPGRC